MSYTSTFFDQQKGKMESEKETDQPAYFPDLQKLIKPESLDLLKQYKTSVENRVSKYQNKIKQI